MEAILDHCLIHSQSTTLDALRALDNTGAGVVMVENEGGQLVGLLTDGDLRRALLRTGSLATPVLPFVKREFISVSPATSRAEVLDLMQALKIDQIPVVNESGRLVGLHLIHETLSPLQRPNIAVLMAGGQGSRLGKLVRNTPKPMLRVAGRPILERLILHFVGFGIRHIYLSVHYLAEVIEEHFGDGSDFGCKIEYLREKEPLGTGGALSLLTDIPDVPLFVCNGDLVTQANLADMLETHMAGRHQITVATKTYSHEIPFGCLEVEEGKLLSLQEKPTIVRYISAGMYVLEPSVVSRINPEFVPITEIIEAAIQRGESVAAWEMQEDWIDVGQREQLIEARGGA